MGKTFGLAIRLIGAAVFALLIVMVWAITMRFDGEARAAAPVGFLPTGLPGESLIGQPPLPAPVPVALPPPAPITHQAVVPSPAPPIQGTTAIPPLPVTTTPVEPLATPQRDARHHLNSPEAREAVRTALSLREKGDTQGALEALKEADDTEKDHPKILAELATTYGQMGLRKKETEHWTKIHEMGIAEAGAYWDLADMFFRGQKAAPEVDSALRIKGHSAIQDDDAEGGQKVMLQIHTEAIQEAPIRARDMVLQVYFYDRVNGESWEATIADVSTHADVTVPYDWKYGTERIDVEYFLPTLTDEQIANHGQREYYGYVVELYYENVLQDYVANPRKLGRLTQSGAGRAEDMPRSGLFPKP